MGIKFSGRFIPLGKLKFYNSSPISNEPSIIDIEGPIIFNEGSSGITNFSFIVVRSGVLMRDVILKYRVEGSGENPASPLDFEGSVFPSGTISLRGGQTSTSFTINVVGDEMVEPDEEFTVILETDQSNVEFIRNSAIGVILNDDESTISFDPPSGSLGSYDMETEINIKISTSIDEDFVEKYEVVSGQLPEGIILNSFGGNISGTLPNVAENTDYHFVIKVTGTNGNFGLAEYSLTVRDTSTRVVWKTPEGTLVDAPSGYGFKRELEAESV